MQRHSVFAAAIVILFITFHINPFLASAMEGGKHYQKNKQKNAVYTDEYNELDDNDSISVGTEFFQKDFKIAEGYYKKALDFAKNGDSLVSKRFFSAAVNLMNKMASIPGIEQNEDYYNLVQSIISDYDAIFPNSEDLDLDSPQFLIFDKISQDKTNNLPPPQIQSLKFIRDSSALVPPVSEALSFLVFTDNIIPLDDNEFVQKNIEYLTTGKLFKYYKAWLQRTKRWFPLLKRIINDESVPKEIIYLAMIESGLNPIVPSRAKAIGMWQFIRSTGELYGLNAKPSIWIDERRNPEKATYAAMHHLRDLYSMFGDWHLVMAAYNCGAGCVQRAINKSKLEKPNFWDLRQFLPKETRNYVPLYIAVAKITMNPAAFGINLDEISFLEELECDTFIVVEPVNLNAIAKCAGISVEEIKALNTELIKNTTPPDIKEYAVRIPKGSKQDFTALFATLTDKEKQPWITHTVRKKETLRSIANMYGISEDEIIYANDLPSTHKKLKAGISLRIPVESMDSKPDAVAMKAPGEQDEPLASKTSPAKQTNPQNQYKIHTVKKGENLSLISGKYNISLAELRHINNLKPEKTHIAVGAKLKVPRNNEPESLIASKSGRNDEASASEKIIRHKVKAGETLAQIADDYNVSIESVKKENHIKSSKLKKGQLLKIKSSEPITRKTADESTIVDNAKSGKLVVHKVKKGENLSTVAARYGVTESQVKKWNPALVDGSTIYSGTRLKIYSNVNSKGSSAATPKKVNDLPKYYNVRRGDTLDIIARKFGISVSQIKKKNKNISDTNLKAGQRIRLQ